MSAPTTFASLDLLPEITRALEGRGYTEATPIQARSIPSLLDGRDLLGIAQTGTGKTAAFALPILDYLAREPLAPRPGRPATLVLSPTRELAAQIGESFDAYGKHLKTRHTVIFGGVGQGKQVQALRRGIDVLVATPGRLLDLMDQGHVDLRDVEVFVLDEADRMLDMGFLPAVRRVLEVLPRERQSLLFSATMPADIVKLAEGILVEPVKVEVTPAATTVERIDQSVLFVDKVNKRKLLAEVLKDREITRALVFTRTKRGADRVVKHLVRDGESAHAIHGDKSQSQRERALDGFRRGTVRVLVATDIAARGLDVKGVSHVINFDLPNEPESYVHRIGRTARAGKDGIAISFCDVDERPYLRDIERTARMKVRVVEGHAFPASEPAPGPAEAEKPSAGGSRSKGRPPRGSGPGGGGSGNPRKRRRGGSGQRGRSRSDRSSNEQRARKERPDGGRPRGAGRSMAGGGRS